MELPVVVQCSVTEGSTNLEIQDLYFLNKDHGVNIPGQEETAHKSNSIESNVMLIFLNLLN